MGGAIHWRNRGDLILTTSPGRRPTMTLAAQHRLPTVYSYYRRYYVTHGGLISYGYEFLSNRFAVPRGTSIAS